MIFIKKLKNIVRNTVNNRFVIYNVFKKNRCQYIIKTYYT